MMRRYPVLRFVLAAILATATVSTPGCRPRSTAPRIEITQQTVAFVLGETTIHAHVLQIGTNPLTLVHLHEDEQTSAEAGRQIVQKHGGRLIRLVHNGRRRVSFTLDGRDYSFDPNRIFSSIGVHKTLRGEVPVPDKAQTLVNEFASRFIRQFGLDREPFLIAPHNNGDGYFSIKSYLPDAQYGLEAEKVFINSEADPDDFFYVTEERFFTQLKDRNFNVVLQNNRIPKDDGSLSVFAARHGIPYINVEAENGHLAEQIRMLEVAVEIGNRPAAGDAVHHERMSGSQM